MLQTQSRWGVPHSIDVRGSVEFPLMLTIIAWDVFSITIAYWWKIFANQSIAYLCLCSGEFQMFLFTMCFCSVEPTPNIFLEQNIDLLNKTLISWTRCLTLNPLTGQNGRVFVRCWVLHALESSHYNRLDVDSNVNYSLCSVDGFIDYNGPLWDCDKLKWVTAFVIIKGALCMLSAMTKHACSSLCLLFW